MLRDPVDYDRASDAKSSILHHDESGQGKRRAGSLTRLFVPSVRCRRPRSLSAAAVYRAAANTGRRCLASLCCGSLPKEPKAIDAEFTRASSPRRQTSKKLFTSPFSSISKAPSKSFENHHTQVLALDPLAWEEPLDISVDDATVASSSLMTVPTPSRSSSSQRVDEVPMPVTTEHYSELSSQAVSISTDSPRNQNTGKERPTRIDPGHYSELSSQEVAISTESPQNQNNNEKGDETKISAESSSGSSSPSASTHTVLSTDKIYDRQEKVMPLSVSMSPPASAFAASPRDSEFGVADWQLGMDAMLDARASQKPQVDCAQHVANLQAEVDFWKERVVQVMCASKMDTKAARRSLVFLWRFFNAWQKQTAGTRIR